MIRIEDVAQTELMIGVLTVVQRRHHQRMQNGWAARAVRASAGATIGEIGGVLPIAAKANYNDDVEVFGDVNLKVVVTNSTTGEGTISPLNGQWVARLVRIYYEDLKYAVELDGAWMHSVVTSS